jgi:pimeloyl-ACP methyl ester carboxylesterase
VSIPPETRYARNGAIHLAYQVLGSGPPDLLVVQSGPNSHVDHSWMEPSLARFIRRLASFSRLILYDNRGVGLSDPVPGSAAPTMDEQVDDVRAVLDETGSRRAVLLGNLAGCAPALVFAATHPGRVESLMRPPSNGPCAGRWPPCKPCTPRTAPPLRRWTG